MKKLLAFLTTLTLQVFLGSTAFAESVRPDADFTMTTPDGWDSLNCDFAELYHPTVAHMLDCVDEEPSRLKQIGWKMEGSKVLGAYCISYRKTGMRNAAVLLRNSRGSEREALSKKFIDTYAGEIQSGYRRRGIALTDMSADLLEAGKDLIMILDSKISGPGGKYMRSATIILHDDALLNVGTVYALDAPSAVSAQLDAMPLSVVWRR